MRMTARGNSRPEAEVRGGQLWEITWATGKFDYFVDGLTSAQKAGLKKTIGNIKLPHVQVRLDHYDTV